MENDYPELSGDFALRGASNSRLCASDGTGSDAGADGSNGNVLQNSQVRDAGCLEDCLYSLVVRSILNVTHSTRLILETSD